MTTAIVNDTVDRAEFARDWEDWHRAHEERRADPHGFLAVTGLYWLGEEPIELPDASGSWRTGTDGPVVELPEGASLTLKDAVLSGTHEFGPLAERSGVTVGFDAGVVEIARRGGRDILRPRRGDHAYLASYTGTPSYQPDPRWRVAAKFVAYPRPRSVEVGAAVDGLSHVYESPGYLEFSLDGETYQLTVFPGHTDDAVLVLFTDATSGVTTYAANRSVLVDAPDAEGNTVIDFNRASNLPCAYTDFATCPLPPQENRLPVGIEAGEKTPVARVEGVATEIGIVAKH
ncbi:DUF1684 domain-containing protein [Microbacterium saperdae]